MLPVALITWLVMGLAAGISARFFMPGPRLPWWATLAVGLLGAILGGLLATLLGFGGFAGYDWRSLVTATLGAMLLLLLLRLAR
ncbi:MAG: GlsB/YeaQ/YmgE family stress response membrane protein [Acidobacteriota bacterium]